MNKLSFFAAAALLLFSCTPVEINPGGNTPGGDTPEDKPATVQVTGITLDKTSLIIKEGESVTLTPTVKPDNATNKSVTWTSGNESVATVDNSGKVTGVKAGTATITATANDGSGKYASCSVTINSSAPVSGEAVDLGLPSGLKWASCNLGAGKPEEYGEYYAWGETSPKSDYSWGTYKWCKGSYSTLTKYCSSDNPNYWAGSGSPDNKTVLEAEDDVACVKLGGKWRMPTDDEWGELINKCTWTWVSNYNGTGVNGRLVTGPNGNSIFLPAADARGGTRLSSAGSVGYYWSSPLKAGTPYLAWVVRFDSGDVLGDYGSRFAGRSVRPVFGDCYVSSVTLNESSLSLEIGQSYNLIASVSPDYASDRSLTWRSSDESIATVDQSGKVTAKSKGSATITATANDGSGVYVECSVDVCKIDGDLGLSVKWATSNLCESGLCANPWDYGDYYAWGETEPYYSSQNPLTWKSGKTEGYKWPSYKWCKGSYDTLTKYCNKSSYGYNGFTDTKTTLEADDDAARTKLGGKWRMPTDAEWGELIDKCTWKWVDNYNVTGVNGRLVIGPNGNSIFLPAAGFRGGTNLYYAGSNGYFWSSSLNTGAPGSAWDVDFNSSNVDGSNYYLGRCNGFSVRPVSE